MALQLMYRSLAFSYLRRTSKVLLTAYKLVIALLTWRKTSRQLLSNPMSRLMDATEWIRRVTSIRLISFARITPELAGRSGFGGAVDLLKVAKQGSGENVY
jgi:hypothetical protein